MRDDGHCDVLLRVLDGVVEEGPAGVVGQERRRHGHEHRDGGDVPGLRRQMQRRVLDRAKQNKGILSPPSEDKLLCRLIDEGIEREADKNDNDTTIIFLHCNWNEILFRHADISLRRHRVQTATHSTRKSTQGITNGTHPV